MSMTTSSSRPARSDVAPRNVSAASSSPVIVRASRPRSATAPVRSAPLAASRTALVSTATAASAPSASIRSR